MENIKDAIGSNKDLTNDQIIDAFKMIGAMGDIIIFKNDGLRSKNSFSVIISSSTGKFDSIRFDADSLNNALIACLRKYFDLPLFSS